MPEPLPDATGQNHVLYFTLDVEPDYARTRQCALLDRTGEFLAWACDAGLPVTAFVVGLFFEEGRPVIDTLVDGGAAVELHGYRHAAADFGTMDTPHTAEIERGCDAFRRRLGRAPAGYRAPSGIIAHADLQTLARLGFRYDASIFPLCRPGRYDFSRAPRTPFRWRGLDLLEFPGGLLTSRLPAGMTFINWFGAGLSRRLIARAAAGGFVLDAHLHNLFHNPAALRELPFALRATYQLGRIAGGWTALHRLVDGLRRAGWTFGSLAHAALRVPAGALPDIAWNDIVPSASAVAERSGTA